MLIRADARDVRQHVADHTVSCIVTSPPYLAQRLYGDDTAEIGLEDNLDSYVQALAGIFTQLRHTLRPDGVAWLNIGDKANGSGGAGGDWSSRARAGGPGKFRDPSYPDQTYLDVPGAVLRALLLTGWRCRAQIVWNKTRQAPEDLHHVRRPRSQHEMIYMLAPTDQRSRFFPERLTETGSVWTFKPGGSGPAHLAPFPDELARRCIVPSTNPGDLVLDPFCGSGTTVKVAERIGRRGVGLDLYA